MFTANENSRRPPGNRMQNGKSDLGAPRNEASWFAAPAPSRTGGPSFAQTIGGGGQNSRPFDPSEFPTLGGGGQQPGPAVGTWNANVVRQRSPERRTPYGRGMGRTQDEAPRESFAPGAEGYRFGSGQTNQTANRSSARSPFQAQGQEQEPIGYTGRQEQQSASLTNDGPSSPPPVTQQPIDSSSPSSKRISEMTDRERYGMVGLVARLTQGHPDYEPLMNGFDLTKLGVAVDSNEPLINTWPGPFDEGGYVIPDFTLPPAYTVNNVPPLASKMEGFSDETLIMIFYQFPRDILQELAAQALYKRDWRWHMKLRCWMMKDTNQPQLGGFTQGPVRLSEKTERGLYIFFDLANWRRERKEIVLNYDDLDTRPTLLQGAAALGAGGAAAANGLGAGPSGHNGSAGGFGAMGGVGVSVGNGGQFGGVGSG